MKNPNDHRQEVLAWCLQQLARDPAQQFTSFVSGGMIKPHQKPPYTVWAYGIAMTLRAGPQFISIRVAACWGELPPGGESIATEMRRRDAIKRVWANGGINTLRWYQNYLAQNQILVKHEPTSFEVALSA